MTTRIFKIKVADVNCERLYFLARKRRTSSEALLSQLIKIILRDDLIAAVLDDGRDTADIAAHATDKDERDYEPGMNPIHDAEFGMKR
jgi:hypothetical protein